MAEAVGITGTTMEERGESLLETGLASDCTFIVGDDKNKVQIAACKAFLIRASPVFERMFLGQLQQSAPVEVPDIEPDVFKIMLRFIYGCKWALKNNDQAMRLCYVAHKYMIGELLSRCEEYLWPTGAENVWSALEVGNLYSLEKLIHASLVIIENDTLTGYNNVLASPDIVVISQNCLMDLIKANVLKTYNEIDIFRMCLRWATAKCMEKELPVDGRHLRNELGKVLFHIRFLIIPSQDFVKEVVKTGILTAEESLSILSYLITGAESPCPLPSGFSSLKTTRYED